MEVTWKKDSNCGKCEFTGYTTQWIATTRYGSIRCFKGYKPFGVSLDLVVWNRILSK